MNTFKPWKLVSLLCIFFVFTSVESQKLGKRIKKKIDDKAVDVLDEKLNGKKKKKKKKNGEEEEAGVGGVILGSENGFKIDRNFIDRSNLIFYDDFDSETPGEFPSKWKRVDGTVENGQFEVNNKREGVVQMVSTRSAIKPSFDTDDYLGDSFKIELENFFWQRGNEAYSIQVYGAKGVSPAFTVMLRSTNVASGSDVIYMAGKQTPGWYTSQISFNKGNLKVIVNGQLLVNSPDINVRECTYVAIKTLSPGSTRGDGYPKARINYIMISKGGLPLYERIVNSGRIVVRDIYFDTDKYEIKPNSHVALDKIVKMLKEHENMEVTIEGHTDANGSEEANQILSEKRAEAVKNYLAANGIKRYRLSSKGYGEAKPIDPSNTEAAWAQNRRVEFVLNKN